MTTEIPDELIMGEHRWELSANGSVIRHRVHKLDQLHMVDDPETTRRVFTQARKVHHDAAEKVPHAQSRRKIIARMINGFLLIIAVASYVAIGT